MIRLSRKKSQTREEKQDEKRISLFPISFYDKMSHAWLNKVVFWVPYVLLLWETQHLIFTIW